MRTLKLTMMVALAFALGAVNANEASINIVWAGGSTTTEAASTSVTGNIVMTTTSALNGAGAGIGLSADSTGDVLMNGSTDSSVGISGWLSLAPVPAAGTHTTGVLSSGDLFGSGAGFAAGTTYTIGTITVNAGANGGTVSIGTTSVGDDIIGAAGQSYLSEYNFGAGTVVVPEPTTASLIGLGLLGLSIAGRNRKN